MRVGREIMYEWGVRVGRERGRGCEREGLRVGKENVREDVGGVRVGRGCESGEIEGVRVGRERG